MIFIDIQIFKKMTCPTCKLENIPSLVTKCPNCATNLVVFKKLAAMEDKYVESAKRVVELEGNLLQGKKEFQQQLRKKSKWNSFLWFLLFLLPLLYYFFGKPAQKEIVVEPTNQIDSITTIYQEKLAGKTTEISELNKTIDAIQGAKVKRELKYVVKKGDILNDLGKLFYNDSTAWYQIALDNKIYDVRGLPVGDTLTIKYRE